MITGGERVKVLVPVEVGCTVQVVRDNEAVILNMPQILEAK